MCRFPLWSVYEATSVKQEIYSWFLWVTKEGNTDLLPVTYSVSPVILTSLRHLTNRWETYYHFYVMFEMFSVTSFRFPSSYWHCSTNPFWKSKSAIYLLVRRIWLVLQKIHKWGAVVVVIVYGSWVYNYICNQCLSPLMLWVPTPFGQCVLDTTLCDKVYQWLVTGRWFSLDTLVSSINKTDLCDITEILLTVALNTITLTPKKNINNI
jgi:hypothetical protein